MGATLRSYAFDKYRTKGLEERQPTLKKVTIGTKDAAGRAQELADAVGHRRAACIWPAISSTSRRMCCIPAEFARRAKALTKLGVKVEVLGEAQMKKLGLGALLGVGQGSDHESQLVVMQWNGAQGQERPRPSPSSARACASIPAGCR